jgi:hypothetical protein
MERKQFLCEEGQRKKIETDMEESTGDVGGADRLRVSYGVRIALDRLESRCSWWC